MAQHKPGVAGEVRGKIGRVVYSKWRKKRVAKETPKRTWKPPSLALRTQRAKFKTNSTFLKQFVEVIQVGFPPDKSNINGWAKAVKYNIKNVITGTFPDYSIDISKIMLSHGPLDQVNTPEMIYEDGELFVDWLNPDHLNLGVEEEDRLQLCVYEPEGKANLFFYPDIAFRKDTYFKQVIKSPFHNGPVHAWIFLVSANGKKVSSSQYLGIFDAE